MSCAALCFIAAGVITFLKYYEIDRQYKILIGVADSTSYEEKKASYIEAIHLCPQRTDAYIKLLNAYEQSGVYDKDESAEFTALYNGAKDLWKEKGGGELTYLAGRLYFGLYTEDSKPVSMSSRVQRAASYFDCCMENLPKDQGEAKTAQCYFMISVYYKDYILANSSKKELTDDAVQKLLNAAKEALEIKSGSEFDRLNCAGAICNLLYDQRTEFARVSTSREEEITSILQRSFQVAEETVVSRPESIEIKNAITANQEEYMAAIKHAFEAQKQDNSSATTDG